MNNRIKKIFSSNDIHEIVINLKSFLMEIQGENDKSISEISRKASQELAKLRKENEIKESNIYIYEGKDAIKAMIAEEIVNCENRRPVQEMLEIMLKEYLETYEERKDIEKKITKQSVQAMLADLEEKYHFISIIKKSGIKVSIMLFDVTSQYQYHFVEYNTYEKGDVAIHRYLHEASDFETAFAFVRQFGIVIQYLLVGQAKRVPDSFREMCHHINLPELDYEAKENITVFTDLFASVFFRKINRENFNKSIPDNQEGKIVEKYFDTLLEDLLKEVTKKEKREEWGDKENCPCGSGKSYRNCCKKKRIKYYKVDEKHYVKAIEKDPEEKELYFIIAARFKKIFGRPPGDEDYVILTIQNNIDKMIRKMKYDLELPRDYVYAYDRTGILLSPYNYDKWSDVDIQEFEDAKKEYREQMKADIINGKGNLLQVAETTNDYLKQLIEENIGDMIIVLNRYIKDTLQATGIKEGFSIKNIKDFLVYASYRTYINLESLEELVKKGYSENALAVVRIIFEILLNVRTFRRDRDLFGDKILPVAGIDEGTFERQKKYTVVNKQTGESHHCKVTASELAGKAGQNYVTLYNTLYYELSGFIHFDTLTAKKIFSPSDRFLEVDESFVAAILAMVFAIEIIIEFSEFEENSLSLKNDLRYYANNMITKLIEALEIIKAIDEKEMYETVIATLEEYKGKYDINAQRDSNNELI